MLLVFAADAQAKPATVPPLNTPSGYVATLLINEVPFPGEAPYISEKNSKLAMSEILSVLLNRLQHVPHPYTQRELAGVRTRDLLDIISVGGVGGQVEGFYQNKNGEYAVLPRVSRRIEHLVTIANQGTPGTFARLLNHATALAENYFAKQSVVGDLYVNLQQVRKVPVTGRAYSWMTNIHHVTPGGNFIVIPSQQNGTLGGNRFFTLRKLSR